MRTENAAWKVVPEESPGILRRGGGMEVLAGVEEFKSFITDLIDIKPRKYSEIIVPARAPDDPEGFYSLTSLRPGIEFQLECHRTADPVKVLFYLFRERVTGRDHPGGERLIAGVKACDIKGMQLLDRAMINDDFTDPAYSDWRSRTTIISSDCTTLHSTCHCNMTGGGPWSEAGFDLNLSRVGNEYLITSGSEKGEDLLGLVKDAVNCRNAGPADLEQVKAARVSLNAELEARNGRVGYADFIEGIRSMDSGGWQDASAGCVGCGACTNICPTCYCLLLNDESSEKEFIKERSYDSCQLAGYATVAGGGTPRPLMRDRFRNRYLCKLDLIKRNLQIFGCTGCGRCIEACVAGIDIRKVVTGTTGLEVPASGTGSEKTVFQGRGV